MDWMTTHEMDLIEDLMHYSHQKKQNASKQNDCDEFGYEYETGKMFSMDPIGFTETVMRLHSEAVNLFDLVVKANRHSPNYFRMAAQLEKLVAQLGSFCLTKAVLEQQGDSISMPDRLTINWLRKITAFNIRKSWTSFMESWSVNSYNGSCADITIRWAALDKRLLATEEKIRKIKAGELRVEIRNQKSEIRNDDEIGDQKTETGNTDPDSRAFPTDGRALPVDKAAIREAQQAVAEQPEAVGEMPAIFEKAPESTADLKDNEAQAPAETAAKEIIHPVMEMPTEDEIISFVEDVGWDFDSPESFEFPPVPDYRTLNHLMQKLRIPLAQSPPG